MRTFMLAMALVLLTGMAPDKPPLLLAIFAHPDDEVVAAPLLARAAREGYRVRIAYATSGDAGPGVSGMDKGPALAALREDEARCASAALGLEEPHFWRLGDGTLGERAQDQASPALALLSGVNALLAAEAPQIVITWGPDGGYGHTDHRMVHAMVSQAVQAMASDRPALLYPGIRSGTKPPIPELSQWAESDPALLPLALGYAPQDRAAAAKSLDCHKSQFPAEVRAGLVPLFDASIWQGAVHLREAFGRNLEGPLIAPAG